jgi:hypothetical protein
MIDRSIGILLAVVSLAALAVIVSKRSNTAKVLDSALTGFSALIRSAVSPVTGK